MKRTLALLMTAALLLCALPALAAETWTHNMGAHPDVIALLGETTAAGASQGFPALAEQYGVDDPDTLPGMKAQVGYTVVERSYPAAGMTAEEYWAMIKDGYMFGGYNLNEVDGGLEIWLHFQRSSTVLHAVWAGDRVFSIAVAGDEASLFAVGTLRLWTVTVYDSETDTVTSNLPGADPSASLCDWLKALKTEGENEFHVSGISATITINQLY